MSMLYITTIPGIMVGVEWDYINKFFVIDLLVIRMVFDYDAGMREKEEDAS